MKRLIAILAVVGLCFGVSGTAFALNSDTQTINFEVQAINELNIDDASVTLTVSTATAGLQPDQATDSSTYDITTNCGAESKKITAAIDTDMAAGLTLKINMTAPGDASSAGAVTLSSSAVDAVTAISAVAEADIAIAYSLDATVNAGVVASASKTLTLTIVDVE